MVNGVEQFKFNAKDSSIVANPLCLGNIAKDWGATNVKKTPQDYSGTCMILVLIVILLTFLIL